jgi:hypothetical protein
VLVRHNGVQLRLQAPPGPALWHWDSFHGADSEPLTLDKLPEWATGENPTEERKKMAAVMKKARGLMLTKSQGEVLDQLVNSSDPLERQFAVFAMGALDDLLRLAEALQTAKHEDVWDQGVLALRHWIGRGPGQDQKLYHGLIAKKGLTPLQAEMVLSLLHSFGDEELAQVETYELLVGYLGHELLPIRGLAGWHLKRLVDEEKVKAIGYDPLAPKEARDKAQAQWRDFLRKAETILTALQNLGDRDLARAQTVEQLVGYLNHELLPIRVLAYRHLKRLADDKQVDSTRYDPTAPREQRDKTQARWRELLKMGALAPKKEQKNETPGKDR